MPPTVSHGPRFAIFRSMIRTRPPIGCGSWANQNPRVKKPVYHFGASLAPDEHLSRQQWGHVADRLLERLGLEEHQVILALHNDRDHEHIHIVVNRVGPDGRAWKPDFDVLKAAEPLRAT